LLAPLTAVLLAPLTAVLLAPLTAVLLAPLTAVLLAPADHEKPIIEKISRRDKEKYLRNSLIAITFMFTVISISN
jgi:hypothetical protein